MVSGGAAVASQGAVLGFTYWLVTDQLGTSYLGLWAIILSVLGLGRIADFGIGQSLLHFVPTALGKGETDKVRVYLATAILASIILFGAFTTAAFLTFHLVVVPTLEVEFQALAVEVFTFAGVGFFLTALGASFTSFLVGSSRAQIAHMITILAQLANLTIVLTTFQSLGLVAMGMGYLATGAVIVTIGAMISLMQTGWVFRQGTLSISLARRMFFFGVKLQLISIATAAVDVIFKFFVKAVLGLEAVGLVELAQRFVLLLRGVCVLPQNYLSAHAGLDQDNPEAIRRRLQRSLEVAFDLSIVFIILIIGFAGLLGSYWANTGAPYFVGLCAILVIGWALNIFSAPVYFFHVGLGEIPPLAKSQLIYLAGVAVLCLLVSTMENLLAFAGAASSGLALSQVWLIRYGARRFDVAPFSIVRSRWPVAVIAAGSIAVIQVIDLLALAELTFLLHFLVLIVLNGLAGAVLLREVLKSEVRNGST